MLHNHTRLLRTFLLALALAVSALLLPARSVLAQSAGTPTTVTITNSDPAPSFTGTFTITVAVSANSGTAIPTGTVALSLALTGSNGPFYSGVLPLLSNGTVTLTYTSSFLGGCLPPGNYTVSASYAPLTGSAFQPSMASYDFTLSYPTGVAPSYTPSPPFNTQNVTVSANVFEPWGVGNLAAPVPSGSLAFTVTPSVGGSPVFTQTETLASDGPDGVASVTIPAGTLAVGTYLLTEAYTPGANSFDILPATTTINMTFVAPAGTQGTVVDRGDFTSVLTDYDLEATPGGNGALPDYLVYDSADGLFYGSASLGGANGVGDLVSFDPSTGAINDVGDFTSVYSVVTNGDGYQERIDPGGNGAGPGTLIYDNAHSVFYGIAGGGGANGDGDVFSFNPSDPNPSTSITDVGDFNTVVDSYSGIPDSGGNGATPSALIYDNANNLYYGTAEFGGATDAGDVFTFTPSNASPSASIADVADFTFPGNGQEPSSLIYDSNSGLFYGTAGNVFAFNPATNALTDAGDFPRVYDPYAGVFTYPDGANPKSLVYDDAKGLFYGTASEGGANGYTGGALGDGDVFSFNPVYGPSTSITDVADFNNTNGASPGAAMVYSPSNGLFYGTATAGATANGDGDVYTFDPTTNLLTDAADFGVANTDGSGNNGERPGALAFDGSGNLYGVAQQGGAIGSGDVFSFVPTPPVTTSGGGGGSGTGGSGSGGTGGGTSAPTPLNTFGAGLQMICLDEDYANLAAAFDTTTPPAYDTYDGSNYVLSNSATEAAPAPGTAFWVYFGSPTSIYDMGSGVTTATIPLRQGWNMIGDPFAPSQVSGYPGYLLANIVVTGSGGQTATGLSEANTMGLLYPTLYSYPAGVSNYDVLDGTASGASLAPFTGYWLYAFQTGETLTMKPGPSEILQPSPLLP